jgi:hypothetical protein
MTDRTPGCFAKRSSMSVELEARDVRAFVFVAAIGVARGASRLDERAQETPPRGGRARGRVSPEKNGRTARRADRWRLRDALATGRGVRKRSRIEVDAKDALETTWGRALSLTARRIEECRLG